MRSFRTAAHQVTLLALLVPAAARTVSSQVTADTSGAVTVRIVARDSRPVEGVVVRAGRTGAASDASGLSRLRLPPGPHRLVAARIGFAPESLDVIVRPGMDTTVTLVLLEAEAELERVVVSATRSERRVEDDPVRVELLDLEEVVEKQLMTPGDITMMLNETSGLRVQTTSPSLGGATVRVQGMRGRYTQILSDGLPIHGGQTGGLGLLQIPPMDLGGVEVIKGVASALYGGSALGGVVNLLSRRPGNHHLRELLLNQTTLGGTDAVLFASGPLAKRAGREEGGDAGWGYTGLVGMHRQRQTDRDGDGWTDLAGYERAVVRPRLFWTSEAGHNAVLTAGATIERRDGGTLEGVLAPDGLPFPERLRTRRLDAGAALRRLHGTTGILSIRGSLTRQSHRHNFGYVLERDRHLTSLAEMSYTLTRGLATWVAGAAWQREVYDGRDIAGFDFRHDTPGAFVQTTFDAGSRVAMTASARVDRHSEYGTFFSPRASALFRLAGSWTLRASAGSGYFAPTPFTELTEVTGLAPVYPSGSLGAEEARGVSLDVGGILGTLELNATLFASRIDNPVAEGDGPLLYPANVERPTRTGGGELLLRWSRDPMRVTATYTRVRSTEYHPDARQRRPVPLTPEHQAGLVVAWEQEGDFRAGLEVYYTGRQQLDNNPYRSSGRSYTHVGTLVERRFGAVRVFVNAENLLNVRQTRYDPLVRPARGPGGRWTTDVWAPLDGRVANIGIRLGM